MRLTERARSEYDLKTVMRRTTLDAGRTPDIISNELRIWDQCAAQHKSLGTEGYRAYLAEQKDSLEAEACSVLSRSGILDVGYSQTDEDGTHSFYALRRLVAIMLQEVTMLDMSEPQLKAIGYDSAFIALGRW